MTKLKIDSDIPMPQGRGQLQQVRDALRVMRPKVDSFIFTGAIQNVYYAAKTVKIKIKTTNQEPGIGIRVWRVK